MATGHPPDGAAAERVRRRYDSPLRRQRAAQTRERILLAGAELARSFPSWDWAELTFRSVAERAGVGERTVYRHFPTERQLHDAVMHRLGEEAGVDYGAVTLDGVADVTARVLRSLSGFRAPPRTVDRGSPTFVAVDEERHLALLRAVEEARPDWPARQQLALAAALDVLWRAEAYARLVSAWDLAPEDAIDVVTWAIGALIDAPPIGPTRRARRRGAST